MAARMQNPTAADSGSWQHLTAGNQMNHGSWGAQLWSSSPGYVCSWGREITAVTVFQPRECMKPLGLGDCGSSETAAGGSQPWELAPSQCRGILGSGSPFTGNMVWWDLVHDPTILHPAIHMWHDRRHNCELCIRSHHELPACTEGPLMTYSITLAFQGCQPKAAPHLLLYNFPTPSPPLFSLSFVNSSEFYFEAIWLVGYRGGSSWMRIALYKRLSAYEPFEVYNTYV